MSAQENPGSTNPPQETGTSELSVAAQAGRLHGHYEVGKAVGKGGYAIVYKGIRKEDGRIIAVKKVEVRRRVLLLFEDCCMEDQLHHYQIYVRSLAAADI